MTNIIAIKLLLVIFVLSSISIFPMKKAYSLSPLKPDPWFSIALSFDKSTLPKGIDIIKTNEPIDPYVIVNKNEEPFYIISQNYESWKTYSESGIPKDYKPHYKLTSKRVYYWFDGSSSETKGWNIKISNTNNSPATSLKIDNTVYELEGETKQIYRDDRPLNVEIPKPQKFTIRGLYKNSPVEIPGSISYSLNNNYDTKKSTRSAESINKIASPPKIVNNIITTGQLTVIILALLSAGFLIYFLFRKLKNNF